MLQGSAGAIGLVGGNAAPRSGVVLRPRWSIADLVPARPACPVLSASVDLSASRGTSLASCVLVRLSRLALLFSVSNACSAAVGFLDSVSSLFCSDRALPLGDVGERPVTGSRLLDFGGIERAGSFGCPAVWNAAGRAIPNAYERMLGSESDLDGHIPCRCARWCPRVSVTVGDSFGASNVSSRTSRLKDGVVGD